MKNSESSGNVNLVIIKKEASEWKNKKCEMKIFFINAKCQQWNGAHFL